MSAEKLSRSIRLIRQRYDFASALVILSLHMSGVSAKSEFVQSISTVDANEVRLTAPVLSEDGRWVAYTLSKPDGTQELVVRNTDRATEFRVPRGALPQVRDSESARDRGFERLLRPTQFTADSRYVIFAIAPPKERVLPRENFQQRPEFLESLGILRLRDGAATRIPQVRTYAMPKESGRHLAYVLQVPGSEEAHQKTLVLRDLNAGTEIQIGDVTEFAFDNRATYLAYIVQSEHLDKSGVFLLRLSDSSTVRLLEGIGHYRNLEFDTTGEQLVFLSNRDELNHIGLHYSLYYAESPFTNAEPMVRAGDLKGRKLLIDADAGVTFTSNGKGVTFNVMSAELQGLPWQVTPAALSSHLIQQADRDKETNVELWHWKDPGVLARGVPAIRWTPQGSRRPQSYLVLYQIDTRRWVQLGNPLAPEVLLSPDGRFAVGINSTPYELQALWSTKAFDLYFVDVDSGVTSAVRRRVKATFRVQRRPDSARFSLSPSGRFLLFFEDDRWWSFNLATQAMTDLTGMLLPAIRFDFTDMTPAPPGIAGWSLPDEHVLLYARHDIWKIDPAGKKYPRNVTGGVGQRENIVFRLWGEPLELLWPTEELIQPEMPLLLVGFDLDSMASSVWRTSLSRNTSPEKLLVLDKRIIPVAKVKNGSRYLLTIESYSVYPDLWTMGNFDRLKKVSNASPDPKRSNRGTVELIDFTSDFGVPLKGLLYKPKEFDSSKKYPLIVDIYSDASTDRHDYFRSTTSSVSPSVVVSNGYLYFRPDVLSRSPPVAQSAAAAVLPGVRALIERGSVDPARVGLVGFSFGGYEVSAIITQTNIFRCAVNASGLIDPMSYYGSIGGFGPSYLEIGQWRQGGTMWEQPLTYLGNSSFFNADRVQTPLLQTYNPLDNAVPISQGTAFFLANQRNGRPIWLITYPGEGHGLARYRNLQDWDRRVMEFFDHYLRGTPEPLWMRPGAKSISGAIPIRH